MATKKLQILDSLIDAYTKTETDNALATKANLITSENLFDVNVFNVANSSLTITPVENEGVRVTGTSTSDFNAVYKGSLIDMTPGEYHISGGNYNSIYFMVKITRANNSVESKYNTTAVFKDDDISRSCAIVLRKSSTPYDEIIYPTVTKIAAEGVLELDKEVKNIKINKADRITSENLFDFNIFNGVTEKNLTITAVENGGLRVTGTPTSNFTGVFKGSLIDMIPGEYHISGGNYNNIYFLVKIVRADNSSETKYNDTIIFKDDDISRSCAIFARKASVSYDEIIYPSVTKTVAEGVLELEQGFKNKFLKNIDGSVEENNLSLNLISKLSYVTPQMFGAVGDGIKNDTDAIQSAINTGKSVYIPKGTYKVGQITISENNAKIYGDGVDNTIIKHDDTITDNECIIHITNNSNCILSSMSIVGGGYNIIKDGSYNGTDYIGIMINNCAKGSQNIIENIDVYKCLGSGIYLTSSCIGCRISNVHTYNNVRHGLLNAGYGNKVVNLDTHQNRLNGITIIAGGFNGTNIKSWGNQQDGINMDNTTSRINVVVLTNISPQQNGRHGLIMANCYSCIITGLQSLANNYKSNTNLAIGTQLESDTAAIVIANGNHNNYIQGSIVSGTYGYWKSTEESSIRIASSNNTNNVIDLSVSDSLLGNDQYDLAFNPFAYTASDGTVYDLDNFTRLPEYKVIRQRYDNPLNIIKINGKIVSNTEMTDIKLDSNTSDLYMTDADGQNYMTVSYVADESNNLLTLALSDYTTLPVYKLDDIKLSGTSNIDISKIAYIRKYSPLNLKNFSYDVLYLRFTAKISEYKSFGIFPLVQILYKDESGNNIYEYVSSSLNHSKSNIIFNTDYVTKNIALDVSKYKGKNILLYIGLYVTRLSDDIQDTATISIKKFSYKLCEKTAGIESKDEADGKDYILTEADKAEIANIVINEYDSSLMSIIGGD